MNTAPPVVDVVADYRCLISIQLAPKLRTNGGSTKIGPLYREINERGEPRRFLEHVDVEPRVLHQVIHVDAVIISQRFAVVVAPRARELLHKTIYVYEVQPCS